MTGDPGGTALLQQTSFHIDPHLIASLLQRYAARHLDDDTDTEN